MTYVDIRGRDGGANCERRRKIVREGGLFI